MRAVRASKATSGRSSRRPKAKASANFPAPRKAQRTRFHNETKSSRCGCVSLSRQGASSEESDDLCGAWSSTTGEYIHGASSSPSCAKQLPPLEPQPSSAIAARSRAATKSKTMSSPATRNSSASRISTSTEAGSRNIATRISGFARKAWNFRTMSSTAPSRICRRAAPSSVPGMWKRQYCSNSSGAVSAKATSMRLPMASKSPAMPSMSAILSSRSALEAGASNAAWFSE
mmetsp:Transcript_22523/g.64839  ORF Transcript_22523/g.64839 Transcript_22523/m.64839 type:complete len:231 (-) Transcript_22523:521-1213(-)